MRFAKHKPHLPNLPSNSPVFFFFQPFSTFPPPYSPFSPAFQLHSALSSVPFFPMPAPLPPPIRLILPPTPHSPHPICSPPQILPTPHSPHPSCSQPQMVPIPCSIAGGAPAVWQHPGRRRAGPAALHTPRPHLPHFLHTSTHPPPRGMPLAGRRGCTLERAVRHRGGGQGCAGVCAVAQRCSNG